MAENVDNPEVTFVAPCLNEAATIQACIREMQSCIAEHGFAAEVVVADNGSTDGSQELARKLGARVVDVVERGYGSALMGGIEAARGRLIVMGDSDLSYDFREAIRMIEKLRAGADLVMGSRFRGRIDPGAMPWLHRYLGNPVLSWLGRTLFRIPISDFHCGLRAFKKDGYLKLGMRTTGMEFASELVVKSAVHGLRIDEVPVTLRKDGRGRPPHLRTWRDGWRHLRFLLTLSPRWSLFVPGAVLALVGVLFMLLGFVHTRIFAIRLEVHTMIVGSLMVTVGFGAMTTAFAMRIYALVEELGRPDRRLERLLEFLTLERGVIIGLTMALAGSAGIGLQVWRWLASGFGPMDITVTLGPIIIAATFVAIGAQLVLASLVYSMLGIRKRGSTSP